MYSAEFELIRPVANPADPVVEHYELRNDDEVSHYTNFTPFDRI